MPQNLELKFHCPDLAVVERRAVQMGARPAGVLRQRDTFFKAPRARLKLREFGDGSAELISYSRPDTAEMRCSEYCIHPTRDAATLIQALQQALGEDGVVSKERRLYLFEHTRIHLDSVAGLGDFVELETVIAGQSEDSAHRELDHVVRCLELPDQARIATAYRDLLAEAEIRS